MGDKGEGLHPACLREETKSSPRCAALTCMSPWGRAGSEIWCLEAAPLVVFSVRKEEQGYHLLGVNVKLAGRIPRTLYYEIKCSVKRGCVLKVRNGSSHG